MHAAPLLAERRTVPSPQTVAVLRNEAERCDFIQMIWPSHFYSSANHQIIKPAVKKPLQKLKIKISTKKLKLKPTN
jgi:hypothetical protein